eukprot:728753_1
MKTSRSNFFLHFEGINMADLYEIEYYNSDIPEENMNDYYDEFPVTVEQKMQLADRANVIYREQLKYMQQNIARLRSMVQDKDDIIENLMLRYDLGMLPEDAQVNESTKDDLSMKAKYQKIWKFAKETALQNHQLREIINELRDEFDQDPFEQDPCEERAAQLKNSSNDEKQVIDQSCNAHGLSELDSLITILDVDEEKKRENVKYYAEQVNELQSSLRKLTFALHAPVAELETKPRTVEQGYSMEKNEQLERQCPLLEHGVKLELNAQETLHLEKIRYETICNEYDHAKQELRKWRMVQVNWNIIKKLFGHSIKSLIPFQLNEDILKKYERLFDGYFRYILDDNVIMPREVTRLISWFYPIFWTLRYTSFKPPQIDL